MKKILSIIVCLCFLSSLWAQENISIGTRQKMYSPILKENREYWVYLPPSYNALGLSKTSYPVIYLLDGAENFQSVAAIQQWLSKGPYTHIPEMIIVGIVNTDRTRDLTPTQSSIQRNGKTLFANSGKGDNFIAFLKDELIPEVSRNYRTQDYRILIGHSFGGLMAIQILLKHTELFNAYVALDPSLWWDNKRLHNEAADILTRKDFRGRSLYLAQASDEAAMSKDTALSVHWATIKNFSANVLPQSAKAGLLYQSEYYEQEDHGSIPIPATYDALRFIFKGITLPVKNLPDNPALITQHYHAVSSRIGFQLIPSEQLLNDIARYCMSLEKWQSARTILEMNLKNYPGSTSATALLKELQKK